MVSPALAGDGIPGIDDEDAVGLCLAGRISPQVALCRLLLGGADAAAIAGEVAARRPAAPSPRWDALSELLRGREAMLERLAGEVGRLGGNHAAIGSPPGVRPSGDVPAASAAGIAAFFDGAVASSPEASVALYSLGDPAILARATAEIVDWLHHRGCIAGPEHPAGAPGPDVLDLGCGIGRLAIALAPRCRSVLGLDVSAGMVAEARRRCAPYPSIRIEGTAGTSLDAVPTRAFDLVLAVDSIPYLVQMGADALATHVAGCARILRPGGRLAILNLSFGRPPGRDVAELRALAAEHGFTVETAGERPFALWDGAAFLLRRDGPASGAVPPGPGGVDGSS